MSAKLKTQVAILMGSETDLPVMMSCVRILEEFGVAYDIKVLSAHRTPTETVRYVKQAPGKGIRVFVAAAGGAAHLAGVIAGHTTYPVIGVPIESPSLKGLDSLLSIVQMPGGIPVGTMAIGKSGAKNAGIFAVEILALSNPTLAKKLGQYKKNMAQSVLAKNKSIKKKCRQY